MTKPLKFTLVLAITLAVAFVLWRPVAAQPVAAPHVSDQIGRYQIVKNDNALSHVWLLDTVEGQVWRLTIGADVPGQPSAWIREDRIDNQEQLADFIKRNGGPVKK